MISIFPPVHCLKKIDYSSLTFIKMIGYHPLVFLPISMKYKYKLANQEAISFNQPMIYFVYNFFDRAEKANGYYPANTPRGFHVETTVRVFVGYSMK